MHIRLFALFVALGLAGCVTEPAGSALPTTSAKRKAQVELAGHEAMRGRYQQAEQLLAPYLYRSPEGDLMLRSTGISSAAQQQAIDTVALVLWETGRDASLEQFSKRYLGGYEREVMLCRLAERNAVYEKAYNCWNELGDVDRARRSVRTESALRILKD